MNFKYKKSLGQNFLKNEDVLKNITSLVDDNMQILEIGPGAGALTKYLVKKKKVIAIETDIRLKEYLDKIANLEVIYSDILQYDLDSILKDDTVIVANLPYYITTPIITKLMYNNKIKKMILMVQNEVADRICANPGSKAYGYFSVLVQSMFKVKKEFMVKKENFIPVPKVDSAVIKLERKKTDDIVDWEKFAKFVKDAFAMKRKNLKNNLKNYDRDKIDSILKKYNLNLNNRAEEVPVEIFIEIVKMF